MQKDEEVALGIPALVVFVFLAFQSGILLWAGGAGVVTLVGVLVSSGRWQPALATACGVTFIVSLLGIMAMISPGWYLSLLDALRI